MVPRITKEDQHRLCDFHAEPVRPTWRGSPRTIFLAANLHGSAGHLRVKDSAGRRIVARILRTAV